MKLKITLLFILLSGLSFAQADKWRVYHPYGETSYNYFFSVLVDNNNEIWAAGYEFWKFNGSTWNVYSENPVNSNGSTQIFTLVADDSNNIWQGAARGFVKYDGQNFTTLYPENYPMWISKAPNGALWAGDIIRPNILKLENNVLTVYNTTDIGLIFQT